VTNALEALDGVVTPTLEIATRLESGADAEYAAVTVCDNGAGFRASYSARYSTLRHQQAEGHGTGARHCEEDHRGARWRIDADNRPEGGARVRIVLPVKDSTRSATEARASGWISCGGKGHEQSTHSRGR